MEHKDALLIRQLWSPAQIAVERFNKCRRHENDPIVAGFATTHNRSFRCQVQVIKPQSQQLRKAHTGMGQGQEPGPVEAGAVGVILGALKDRLL